MPVMVVFFLLQVTKRFPQHIGHDASAGYHKQKVRHGSHLLPVKFRGGMVRGTAMDGAQAEDSLAQALAQGHVQNAIQPNFLFFPVQKWYPSFHYNLYK